MIITDEVEKKMKNIIYKRQNIIILISFLQKVGEVYVCI